MQYLPLNAFYRIVARYDGDRRVWNLNFSQQFRAMAFAQLTSVARLNLILGAELCFT